MSHVLNPQDLVDNYKWMKRMVAGLETQSIKTVRGANYGIRENIPLSFRAGWAQGKNEVEGHGGEYSKPYARVVADHTTIFGAICWISGEDERALAIPIQLRPFENHTFLAYNDSLERVRIRVTTTGFLYAPAGVGSPIVLNFRYATAREGG